MTNKIIEAAREAGVSITVHSGKPGGPWAESHFVTPNLERFYALAYRQALEDAAQACRPFGKTGAVMAAAIKALKEQQHG